MIGTKLHVDHGSPYQFQWGGWQGGGQRQKGFCPKATGTDQVKDDDINKGCNYIWEHEGGRAYHGLIHLHFANFPFLCVSEHIHENFTI